MAPVTFANLTSGYDTTAGTTATTASVSPSPNRLLHLAIGARNSSGSVQPPTPGISGNGLTWALVDATNGVCNYDVSGTDRNTLFLFRSMGTSPSSGTITITFGSSVSLIWWALDQSDANVDTSGSNGSGAIVQTAKNEAGNNVNTLAATLGSAFGDAVNNSAYGCAAHQHTNEATSAGSGFTLLANVQNASGSSNSGGTEYRTGQDLTVDMSWTTATNRSGVIAVEVKAAAAAATSSPVFRRDPHRGLYMR